MDKSAQLSLKEIDRYFIKASNLLLSGYEIAYNLNQLTDSARLSPERDVFFTYAVWLDIFLLQLDENRDEWQQIRETKVNSILGIDNSSDY